MAIRNIVRIDRDKCNGCGKCVNACIEGAIQLVDGKAQLISEAYCDGLGACIGHCPQGAITIERREAEDFDRRAVEKHLTSQSSQNITAPCEFTCPGMMSQKINIKSKNNTGIDSNGTTCSRLGHWPIQLSLVSPDAPYLAGSDLLLVADCVPFALADFHNMFLRDHCIVIGCPKLDNRDFYIDKLAEIIKLNHLNSLAVVHMEVPCCSALVHIASTAISRTGLRIPFEDVTISLNGKVLRRITVNPS